MQNNRKAEQSTKRDSCPVLQDEKGTHTSCQTDYLQACNHC
jgi:hypothetical protein